jgi:hypothetical protein
MSAIPLYLQRRCEQRWAARFVSPAASAAPKRADSKGAVSNLPRPGKTKENPPSREGGLGQARQHGPRKSCQVKENDPSTGARTEAVIHRM